MLTSAVLLLSGLLQVGPGAISAASPGTSIVVAGELHDVGRPVVLWNDSERGFNGYADRCLEERARAHNPCCRKYQPHYRPRPARQRTLAQLQQRLRLIVLHHDGCANSRSCFYLMHDGCKKLSAHFMIDNDGTIYQTLDLAEIAYHARQVNDRSVGIELCNLARAGSGPLPPEYQRRPRATLNVRGQRIEAFDFRNEQYDSVVALTRTLLRLFPAIPAKVPLGPDNQPHLDPLPDPARQTGVVGHVHVDAGAGKWDPGAFRWLDFLDALTGVYLPLEIDGYDRLPLADPVWSSKVAQAAYGNAERVASAQFPVMAGGLLHAGVNLRARPGATVVAPAAGVIVAARLAERGGSSTAFVLIRHELERVAFYSLLYHLQPALLDGARQPPWLERSGGAQQALREGRIALLEQPVAAGEVVGYVGQVRRGPEQGPELRFEIFSNEALPDPGGFWQAVSVEDGPFARAPILTALLDPGSGGLGARALRRLFREPRRWANRVRPLRGLYLEHVHEWSSRLGETDYQSAPELSQLSASERRQLHEVVAAPYLFLTPELARHAGIDAGHRVRSYHPIAFLEWLVAQRRGVPLRAPVGPLTMPEPRAGPSAPAAAREVWLEYLRPPPLDQPPFHLRLVRIPARLKRPKDMPLIEGDPAIEPAGQER